MKKILVLLLAIILSFGTIFGVGCDDGDEGSGGSNVTINVQKEGNIYNLNREVKSGVYKGDKQVVKGKYLIAQNKTDYKIVVPQNATSSESFAAGELQVLLLEATGYKLQICTDDQVFSGDKFISVGHTKMYSQTGDKVTYSEYHRSGYHIFTKNSNIYIAGANSSQALGTIYGAYEYLSQVLNYECYSQNCYYIDKVTAVPFYEMDITIIPQMETRSVKYNWTDKDNLYNTRLKMVNRFHNQTDWILDSHTNLIILPYETYGKDHPEWYMNALSGNANQLCLMNDEMRAEYVKRVKEYILSSDKGVYFMLSNMDNYDYCTCDKCTAEIERCGTIGGYNVVFVNKVAREVGAWLEENHPERNVTFVTYAYQATYAAPVKTNADGSYSPYCDDVILEDNVAIMIAPLEMDYGRAITDSVNSRFETDFKKWATIAKQITVYDYGTYYFDYLAFLNSFNSLAENIAFYAENGCMYYFSLLPTDTASAWFYDLRTYISSKLAFCPYYEIGELIKDFCDHYYLEASEPMHEILQEMITWYNYLHDELNVSNYVMTTQWSGKSEHWPRAMMANWYAKVNQAYTAIEKYKTQDVELYNQLYKRIRLEELGLDYYQMRFYSSYYADSDYDAMYNAFAKDIGLYGLVKSSQPCDGSYYLKFKR